MTQAERVRLRLGSHCSVLSTLFNPMDCTWAPLSMGFSQQVYWSGLPFPSLGDLPDPGIEPTSPVSPILTGRFFYRWATWQAPRVGCRDWYSSSLAPNKHKCGNFQQQPNMNSQSCRSEAWWAQLYPLLRVSLSRNLCGVACLPFWGPWKKTCFWAHSGHEQNSVPWVLFPGWLSSVHWILLPEATCISSHFPKHHLPGTMGQASQLPHLPFTCISLMNTSAFLFNL